MTLFRRLSLAISYVTCISISRVDENANLEGLAKYLPAAGILIGFLLVLMSGGLTLLRAHSLLCGTLLAVAWLILTNGLHFDGLMDTADGIFSHQKTERVLEIMQDSRVGNFGVLAGVSVLLIKIASLATLESPERLFALLYIPVWARWAETFAIGSFPYLKPEGKGKIWHDSTKTPRDIVIAGLAPCLMVAAAGAMGYWEAALVSAFTAVSGMTAAFWLNRKLGGHTGDTYGCVVEIAEAGGLLLSALILPLQLFR